MDKTMAPKHKVFLSHSGKQKDFVYQLYRDLERVSYTPFFDVRRESLELGVHFPDAIFSAIRKCSVVVLILSEDFFTKSPWPMLELAAAVDAQAENPSLIILPLFLKISPSEFKDPQRRTRWYEQWEEWASERRGIDLTKWKAALEAVNPIIGLTFEKGARKVEYRTSVVESICRICPNIIFDESQIVGRERLYKIMSQKLDECLQRTGQLPPSTHRCVQPVVGVFGMDGLGKTTLCKLMCNRFFQRFSGKVCYVDMARQDSVQRQKKILERLTEADESFLKRISDSDEGYGQLGRISRHKVFLALDNVSDEDVDVREEVSRYLSLDYADGSLVLVTSRSSRSLQSLGIHPPCCLEMPELEEMEAVSLFLQSAAHWTRARDFLSYTEDEQCSIMECVRHGYFKREDTQGSHFHPLILRALGGLLGGSNSDPKRWVYMLARYDVKNSMAQKHPVFSYLRCAYDALPKDPDTARLMFMDLALYKPFSLDTMVDTCKWLQIVHRISTEDINGYLDCLRTQTLLDDVSDWSLHDFQNRFAEQDPDNSSWTFRDFGSSCLPQVVIHYLYRQFAQWESRRKNLQEMVCYYHEGGNDVPREMQERPPGNCWPVKRMALVNGKFSDLADCRLGDWFCNVVVLRLEYLENMTELNLDGMVCLASLSIRCCTRLGRISGLQSLKNLGWLQVARCKNLEAHPILEALPALEYVEYRNSFIEQPLRISMCPKIYVLSFGDHTRVTEIILEDMLDDLRKLIIDWVPKVRTLSFFMKTPNLQVLQLLECKALEKVEGFEHLKALQKVHLRDVSISDLPGVNNLTNLQELVCEHCLYLNRISIVVNLPRLQVFDCLTSPRLPENVCLHELKAVKQLRQLLRTFLFSDEIVNSITNVIVQETETWAASKVLQVIEDLPTRTMIDNSNGFAQQWLHALKLLEGTLSRVRGNKGKAKLLRESFFGIATPSVVEFLQTFHKLKKHLAIVAHITAVADSTVFQGLIPVLQLKWMIRDINSKEFRLKSRLLKSVQRTIHVSLTKLQYTIAVVYATVLRLWAHIKLQEQRFGVHAVTAELERAELEGSVRASNRLSKELFNIEPFQHLQRRTKQGPRLYLEDIFKIMTQGIVQQSSSLKKIKDLLTLIVDQMYVVNTKVVPKSSLTEPLDIPDIYITNDLFYNPRDHTQEGPIRQLIELTLGSDLDERDIV